MARTKKPCDVFVSHAAADSKTASEIVTWCRESGLVAMIASELTPGERFGDAVWEALAESRAIVALIPASGPTSAMAIELGAAWAWNKPIFGVVTDPSATRLTTPLVEMRLLTLGRVDEIIRAIKEGSHELSEEDRTALAAVYSTIGVSVDQLAIAPILLADLVRQFRAKTKKSIAGERLLSELLRMRKQGRLSLAPKAHRQRRKTIVSGTRG